MKPTRSLLVLALAGSLSLPLQAQSRKEKAAAQQAEKLVSALLAVSPDMLGGRLGLDLTATRVPSSELAVTNAAPKRVAADSADQIAYKAWKAAKKS